MQGRRNSGHKSPVPGRAPRGALPAVGPSGSGIPCPGPRSACQPRPVPRSPRGPAVKPGAGRWWESWYSQCHTLTEQSWGGDGANELWRERQPHRSLPARRRVGGTRQTRELPTSVGVWGLHRQRASKAFHIINNLLSKCSYSFSSYAKGY